VGIGDPLEASHALVGPLPAGAWHLVGDGVALSAVDVQFDVLWRSSAGDQTVASFAHHFDPALSGVADRYDGDATGAAVPAASGDLLVLRMTAVPPTAPGPAFVPNADGSHAGGRIPSLTLP
jgi:hypothetical protein